MDAQEKMMMEWRDLHVDRGMTVGPLHLCQVHPQSSAHLWTVRVLKSISILLQDVCALDWRLFLRIMAEMKLSLPFVKLFTGLA